MKRLFLDMDGVIVDFVGGVYREILRQPVPNNVQWNFVPEWAWGEMGTSFWANLAPTPEFLHICRWVEDTFGWENTIIASSPCLTPGCMEGKLRWISNYLPQMSRRYFFGPEKKYLAGPGAYLLDDREEYVEEFNAAGGTAFLFPRSWNSAASLPVAWELGRAAAVVRCHNVAYVPGVPSKFDNEEVAA